MKLTFLLCILALFTACSTTVTIPAGETVTLTPPAYALSSAEVKNKSVRQVEVGVVDKKSGKTLRGFGLGTKAKAAVEVENSSELVLTNTQKNDIKVNVDFTETEREAIPAGVTMISFKLINPSAESIPLLIPDVMNPNLSPNSESGVDLKIGQEIFFRAKGKKYLLLTVNEDIQPGEKIDVRALLTKRKAELGL